MIARSVLYVLLLTSLSFSVSVLADDSAALSRLSVKERLTRIERILGSDVMLEQSRQVEQIQREIAELRELIELENLELELIKQRQRNLYMDMDRRINGIEAVGMAQGSGVPSPMSSQLPDLNREQRIIGQQQGDKKDYDSAFQLLKDGQYKIAISAFRAFLQNYPGSKYSDNAQYWLGEASYVSRNYKQALKEFERLVAAYPASEKVQGARLKIGYTYYELGNWSEANNSLQKVIKDFPDSTVARKASQRLQRIKREGH